MNFNLMKISDENCRRSGRMRLAANNKTKFTTVWLSNADQRNEKKQQELKEYIAECKNNGIFVCVYESGNGNLLENTKELLAYNLSNPPPCAKTSKLCGAQ